MIDVIRAIILCGSDEHANQAEIILDGYDVRMAADLHGLF